LIIEVGGVYDISSIVENYVLGITHQREEWVYKYGVGIHPGDMVFWE